jgi:nucleotide-binding universal stress UspA family protein
VEDCSKVGRDRGAIVGTLALAAAKREINAQARGYERELDLKGKTMGETRMRILLPIDGSEFSDAAVQTVASTIRPEGTRVAIFSIVEPLEYLNPPQMDVGYAPELNQIRKERKEQARIYVTTAAQRLQSAGFDVDTSVVEDEIRGAILDFAKDWKADLIVVGSHGRRGLTRFMLGSVAESIARHAHCSVWIVRKSS